MIPEQKHNKSRDNGSAMACSDIRGVFELIDKATSFFMAVRGRLESSVDFCFRRHKTEWCESKAALRHGREQKQAPHANRHEVNVFAYAAKSFPQCSQAGVSGK